RPARHGRHRLWRRRPAARRGFCLSRRRDARGPQRAPRAPRLLRVGTVLASATGIDDARQGADRMNDLMTAMFWGGLLMAVPPIAVGVYFVTFMYRRLREQQALEAARAEPMPGTGAQGERVADPTVERIE